jgi:signal transduction histidine kinase
VLKLRNKLLVAYIVTLIPLSVGFGWWAFTVASAGLEAELGRTLSGIADSIAADYSIGGTPGRIARMTEDSHTVRGGLQSRLQAVQERTGVARIRLLDAELRSLVDTEETEPFARYFDLERDQFEVDRVLDTGQATSSVLFFGADGRGYKVGYGLITDSEGEPVALVAVEGSASYFRLLKSFRAQVALFGLGVLLLIVLVTIIVSRRITAPLSELSEAASRIGGGDLHVKIPASGDDEIGHLSGALSQMQRDLADRDEETQMMLAGIAHEIRNPLGGMELFVGLLEDSLPSGSEDAHHASKVRRELNYLSRVVEDFLTFARDRPLACTRREAQGFLEEIAAGARAAADAGVPIKVSVPDGLEVSGDLSALRGMLINLVQNAAQASSSGEPVHVSAEEGAGNTRIILVRDSGTGMPAEVLKNVLRPFYTTREKGTGLGLPLAKKVVERHGGTLTLESKEGIGTTVRISLPFDCSANEKKPEAGLIGLDDSDWDGEMIG